MGSVVSNMYGGFQYMLSCGGENQRVLENGGSLTATPFVWKRTRYVSLFRLSFVSFGALFLFFVVFWIPTVIL